MIAIDFPTYQHFAVETAIYPDVGKNLIYPILGLVGEAGELANKVKKIQRDHDGVLTEEMARDLAAELGDVLWYCAAVAHELDADLGFIAKSNLDKLYGRKLEGKLKGSGDDR